MLRSEGPQGVCHRPPGGSDENSTTRGTWSPPSSLAFLLDPATGEAGETIKQRSRVEGASDNYMTEDYRAKLTLTEGKNFD